MSRSWYLINQIQYVLSKLKSNKQIKIRCKLLSWEVGSFLWDHKTLVNHSQISIIWLWTEYTVFYFHVSRPKTEHMKYSMFASSHALDFPDVSGFRNR